MKLYEEFKEYETLWEEKEFKSEYARLMSTPEGRAQFDAMSPKDKVELYRLDRAADPVNKILDSYKDFEFEYKGFEYEWFKDKFDPFRWHGHYQETGIDEHPDFTYTVDATTIFDHLGLVLNDPDVEHKEAKEVAEYLRLLQIYKDTTGEDEEAAEEALSLYLATNLETFVEIFYDELLKYFEDDAYEWAGRD